MLSKEVLNLVDDFSAWDNFPWGQYIWKSFTIGLSILTPSSDEINKPWWKSSLEYFHNVSNASTSSHAPSKNKSQFKRKVVRTEVSREVHVHIEVSRALHVRTDVHHYVDEGLSVQNLVKKIGVMQREFQSRIIATSNIANDSPIDNVFSDTSDFDHDTLVESDVDNQNVDNHSIDFDHDPKTSFEFDVNIKNVDNHSMDVDHDPKAPEEPIMAGNNLFQEEDQTVLFKEFGCSTREVPNVAVNNLFQEEDQQFSAKKLEAQLEMKERFAVDTLCSLIDLDFPTKLPTEPLMPEATVQGCNNIETAQSIITEYESQDEIHDQLDTLSIKNVDSVQGSNDAKVDVNPTFTVNSLRVPLERDHKVSSVDRGLLGIDKERRGWLSDTHLDLWVLYLWHFRPAKAD
uniref:Phospholipase-like protein n=1 Tax=Tanacetum cinerariifolium TaxID=118510 RepID=A0A6L2LQU2_TANCI|nr:phospholipase-like protein [Tanacetum cinerariifolium]